MSPSVDGRQVLLRNFDANFGRDPRLFVIGEDVGRLGDVNLVFEGLRREDLFTVVHEQVMTDTARHADYLLPATTEVEHLDLVWSWGHDYLTLNQPAIEPVGEAIPNTELFRRLAAAMGYTDTYFGDSDLALVRLALASDHPHLAGITYESLLRDGWARLRLPEGWRPFAEGGFPTRSGRCEFFSEGLAQQGMDPLPTFQPSPESAAGNPALAARYPLSLITGKGALHFLNSSYGGLERHRKAEVEPRLDLSPPDAAARGVADGEMVRAAYTLHPEDDDWGQAGTMVREVLDDAGRERLVNNIVGNTAILGDTASAVRAAAGQSADPGDPIRARGAAAAVDDLGDLSRAAAGVARARAWHGDGPA